VCIKRVIIGIICITFSLVGFLFSKQIEATYPTGYLVGTAVSSLSALVGVVFLLPPIVYLVKKEIGARIEERREELEERLWEKIAKSPYMERLKRDTGKKEIYNTAADTAKGILNMAYDVDPKRAWELAYRMMERLQLEVPGVREPLYKAFKELYRKLSHGK
jgi:hypothetical protein